MLKIAKKIISHSSEVGKSKIKESAELASAKDCSLLLIWHLVAVSSHGKKGKGDGRGELSPISPFIRALIISMKAESSGPNHPLKAPLNTVALGDNVST